MSGPVSGPQTTFSRPLTRIGRQSIHRPTLAHSRRRGPSHIRQAYPPYRLHSAASARVGASRRDSGPAPPPVWVNVSGPAQQLGKWAVLLDQWPMAARAINKNPGLAATLEDLAGQEGAYAQACAAFTPSLARDVDGLRKFSTASPGSGRSPSTWSTSALTYAERPQRASRVPALVLRVTETRQVVLRRVGATDRRSKARPR